MRIEVDGMVAKLIFLIVGVVMSLLDLLKSPNILRGTDKLI